MAAVYRLTLLPYLQAWQTASSSLAVRVLLVPTGDPRVSLTSGLGVAGPAMADAHLVLTANLSQAVDQLPLATAVDKTIEVPLVMPADRHQVFDQLAALFSPSVAEVAPVRTAANTMSKYLTQSYRNAFAFTQPRTALALTDESYRCILRCPPKVPLPTPQPPVYSWADALGYAMRHPLVLRHAGLLHDVTLTLPAADFYHDGGWLFFSLAPASDYAGAVGKPGFFRNYATRVPPLAVSQPRAVFTAVLFPVFADATAAAAAAASYDDVFPEAIQFDDGFAKIVHATQPLGMRHLDEDRTGAPPVADLGVMLGWDDEDVLAGQNRQIGLNPDGSEPAEAPRGAVGYRVDVRETGTTAWTTLSQVHGDHWRVGALDLGPLTCELRTEVHPRRLGDRIWLPAYFSAWTGGSLVVATADDKALRGATPTPPDYDPVGVEATPLRYGHDYEFRVRMVDGTSGGPVAGDEPFNGGEAPVAKLKFRRLLPPKKLTLINEQASDTGWTFDLVRPQIDYPAAVFAGIPNAVPRLRAIYDANAAAALDQQQDLGLPDPDVRWAEIRVLVRPPAFDADRTVNGWRELYTTYRAFPADPAANLAVQVAYADVSQVADLDLSGQTGAPGSKSGPLVAPTARDLRLEITALGANDLTYFYDDAARSSALIATEARAHAGAEPSLFRALDPTQTLRSVFLRNDPTAAGAAPASVQAQNDPAPVLVQRLAAAAGLAAAENDLLARPGERVVFGCAGLKHRLSPDNGTLSLTHVAELANLWINVLRFEVDRDWTWRGAGVPTLAVRRTVQLVPGGPTQVLDCGSLAMLHSVNATAVDGEPERDRTVLVFLDAFTAPTWNGKPYELAVRYDLKAQLDNGQTVAADVETVLPITTPPTQVPAVAAAGHALSAFSTDEHYARTLPRARQLWLEFAEPLADPRDAYFVRILAHAPDPLLLARAEPTADPPAEAKSPLDPELVRLIVPGQADDFAGLATMQKLVPADGSDRHFLVPLPPGTEAGSPELFGFYSYEVRVGHDSGTPASPFWSTAQGRFGAALILEGAQHPAPQLRCSVTRIKDKVVASAPFAQPFYQGANVLPSPPNTEIWMALYVQVEQADRATMRNIQLDLRRGAAERQLRNALGVPRQLDAATTWPNDALHTLLAALGLPDTAPLSVLAIELLPEPNGGFVDPLGGDLGDVRILRTSPLTPVQAICCG